LCKEFFGAGFSQTAFFLRLDDFLRAVIGVPRRTAFGPRGHVDQKLDYWQREAEQPLSLFIVGGRHTGIVIFEYRCDADRGCVTTALDKILKRASRIKGIRG
jgi:hypothetical protein